MKAVCLNLTHLLAPEYLNLLSFLLLPPFDQANCRLLQHYEAWRTYWAAAAVVTVEVHYAMYC